MCGSVVEYARSRSHSSRQPPVLYTKYGNTDCDLQQDFRELLARKDIDAVLIACHAAAIAWILQRKLSFDPVKEVFTTALGLDDEANLLGSRTERNPWA